MWPFLHRHEIQARVNALVVDHPELGGVHSWQCNTVETGRDGAGEHHEIKSSLLSLVELEAYCM